MLESIITSFCDLISQEWKPTYSQVETLKALYEFSEQNGYSCSNAYEESFYEAVNNKLTTNLSAYQHILDVAFFHGIKLNYLHKTEIRALLDSGNSTKYRTYLIENGISSTEMLEAFTPVERFVTMQQFNKAKENDKQFDEMLNAIFSRYCYNLFDKKCTSLFFSKSNKYAHDYFDFISAIYPDMCQRNKALSFVDITADLFEGGYSNGCDCALKAIKQSFDLLNNHCDMAIYVPDLEIEGHSIQWKLFADLVLYAEKMNPEKIDRMYFHWKKIKSASEKYINGLDSVDTDFSIAFQGFVFKDCFVLQQDKSYSLLLIFEKNMRDERPLYCPACRSLNIEGNSYPILNVRSWECQNPLCPDRSKYNRGKRYAFSSIMRQKLMSDEANRIPEKSIAAWRLDYVKGFDKHNAFEMVLRHYSCVGDGIMIFTSDPAFYSSVKTFGRDPHFMQYVNSEHGTLEAFKQSSYFKRYIQNDKRPYIIADSWKYNNAVVYNGDSFEILKGFENNSIDGAVTSPPYYNAKSYSQWENIYCYLYDMYNISTEIFRVLKPGAVYLFNIFDYFDNEKNIVFSAMGNKRMILGAYMLDIFTRIGFFVQGNIIWYKGEIQGNRSFNQGNLTPYYQAPLNCWEHIFILSKGKPDKKYKDLKSCIAAIRPVVKIVKGKNILGHTAPYPTEIPDLLLKYMKPGDSILDPFLGSGTTCIAAEKKGIKSIGIEKNPEYFKLCQSLIQKRSCFQLSFDLLQ
ncbi:site-specific DNA-methyltransferase [bacterium]|nr:site-specific DNA-methyltransferase [bacterium]